MRQCGIVVGLSVFLMSSVAVLAEPPSTEELMKTIHELKARVTSLEKEVSQQKISETRQDETLKLIKEMQADTATRAALPQWMDNLTFYGDLRLRYQGECFSGRNEKNRNRARFRVRFGVKKTWLDDQLEVGFRLATGSSDDPTSTNQTFDDHFSEKKVWIDLAYAKYKPKWAKGLTVIGGKMKNPLVHTDLVWDSDLNPEGVWAQFARKCGDFEPFANVGYFILDESGGGHDTILMTYQAGFNWKLCEDVKWTFAGTYYDTDHYDTSYRAANGNNVVGGDLAAGKFQMVGLTNKVSFKAFNLPMSAYFDFIHNCGDEDTTAGYEDQCNGYAAGVKVGKNKKKGDWSFGYKYAYIEANATPGAWNDSDFGHSNRKGHVLGAAYNLSDSLTLGGKLFHTEPIAGSSENQRDTTVQADLVWKF